MTTSDTRFRFFLGGARYLLGDDSTAIYLFDRDRPDQPLQKWPNTIDGRIAAKTRLRELDDNIVALPGGPSAALVPRGQAASAEEDVVEAEVISNYRYAYGPVMGCPRCSTIYWLGTNEWREICTECGAAPLWDVDALLEERELALGRELHTALEPLRNKRRAVTRQQRATAKITPRVLFGGITPGPFVWYMTEQYSALSRYGRRLTRTEAVERIDAIRRQQVEAAQAQRQRQIDAAAVLGFLSVSHQLNNIERNQRRGF